MQGWQVAAFMDYLKYFITFWVIFGRHFWPSLNHRKKAKRCFSHFLDHKIFQSLKISEYRLQQLGQNLYNMQEKLYALILTHFSYSTKQVHLHFLTLRYVFTLIAEVFGPIAIVFRGPCTFSYIVSTSSKTQDLKSVYAKNSEVSLLTV